MERRPAECTGAFVSSNPSISYTEDYPRWDWSDDLVGDFFSNRFGGGRKEWVKDGVRALRRDGTYGGAVSFWIAVRERARELFQREPDPGVDYALTEVVHCKSWGERGVEQAVEECAERWLNKVLETCGARLIVILGSKARDVVRERYKLADDLKLVGPLHIGGRGRMLVFLPHPNARMPRTFQAVLSAHELEQARKYAGGSV